MDEMKIVFYESSHAMILQEPTIHQYNGWAETERAIANKTSYIATTQMGLLSTRLIEWGYKIYVHPIEGARYNLRLEDCEGTTRKIHMDHNLFKLWQAGEFYKEKEES